MKPLLCWSMVVALASTAVADGKRWTVDKAGTGDFENLQQAVDTASDGDVIVVLRAGVYPEFLVDDKELTIVARELEDVRARAISIRDLAAGKTVAMIGISTVAPSSRPALTLLDNAGSVRFERGQIDGSSEEGSLPGLLVQDCADVVVRGAFIRGAPDDVAPGPGLWVADSNVAVYDTIFEGGAGLGLPTDGGPGVHAISGFLFLSGCVSVGGTGSGGKVFGDPLGDGGPGIRVESSADVRAQATSLLGGGGGQTCIGERCECCGADGPSQEVVAGGNLELLRSQPRNFNQYASAFECGTLPINVSGQSGEQVRLLFSLESGFSYRPDQESVFGLGEPLVAFARRISDGGATGFLPLALGGPLLGEIDGNGVLQTEIPFRRLPTGCDAQVFFVQAALKQPGVGLGGLSPPATVVLLRDPFCGIERLHVDAAAAPGGSGDGWSTAISELDVALAQADADGIEEIWVREGVYLPAAAGGSRFASFVVPPDLRLYGGFKGVETRLEQRAIEVYRSVLSGDLEGDDVPGPGFLGNADNSVHVVILAAPGGQTVDGFTIEGGNADMGLDLDSRGAGVLASAVSSWTLANCTLVRNQAVTEGGGLYANGGSYVVASCSFLGNGASLGGGVYSVADGAQDALLVNDVFSGNLASSGAGLFASGGTTSGVTTGTGAISMVNCSFSANEADLSGGGARLVNLSMSYPVTIANSIFWANSDADGFIESSQVSVDPDPALVSIGFSCVEGLDQFAGSENVGSDPVFIDSLGPDGLSGTLDDDLQLGRTSPCIDSGQNLALPPDLADLDADADHDEPTPRDRMRRARQRDVAGTPDAGVEEAPIVDRGAFEQRD